MYLNHFSCCGNLVADPTLQRYNDTPYAKFIIALNKPGARKAIYIDCILWGDLSLRLADYCTKGSSVFLTGELETDSFLDGRGSHHKSTSLRVEKFSVIQREGKFPGAALKKPTLPDVPE